MDIQDKSSDELQEILDRCRPSQEASVPNSNIANTIEQCEQELHNRGERVIIRSNVIPSTRGGKPQED
jgi:hypothetical protein